MAKSKTQYVDGFVLVVPKNKVAAYKKMAEEGKRAWMKYGALDYKECMGVDVNPKMQPGWVHQTFPKLARMKNNETVWFSYITYKSKKHRDAVNAKVMKDMDKAMQEGKEMVMPFDVKRFTTGGFKVVVG